MDQTRQTCLVDPDRVLRLLGAAADRFVVRALPECASTSSQLLELAQQGAPAGLLLVADRQTGGRGRRGRQWLSSPEASLTFSLLWRFPGDLARLSGLSLAVGVAVARALERVGVAGVALKWPNDILLRGGKVAGVLLDIERQEQGTLAVIGIGLNLCLPPGGAAVHDEFLHRPAAIAQVLPAVPDRHHVLAELLRSLAAVLDSFVAYGFGALRDEWQELHAWQGLAVRLLDGERLDRQGVCVGADTDGALLLRTASGVERCLAGDLSLRVA